MGTGTLTVLSPTEEQQAEEASARLAGKDFDWNRLSTAMKLEWNGLQVVLGSDLVEKPGKGWSSAENGFPGLAMHAALKAPHHGSRDAPSAALLAAPKAKAKTIREWVLTPFSRQELPRFKRDESKKIEGAEILLKHENKFHLTGLPIEYSEQSSRHRNLKRRDLAKSVPRAGPPAGFPDCWIELVIDANGKATVRNGPGSVTVT